MARDNPTVRPQADIVAGPALRPRPGDEDSRPGKALPVTTDQTMTPAPRSSTVRSCGFEATLSASS